MKLSTFIVSLCLIGLTACSAEDRAQMEKDKLDSFDLTPKHMKSHKL